MTVQNLYTQYLDGKITKQKFLYEVRRDQHLDMISPNNSFDDVVKILKNKSIISEKAHKEAKLATGKQEVDIIAKTIDMVNPYEYSRGMDYELNIMDVPASSGDLSTDNILKAQKKVLTNLTKNPQFYFDKINGKGEVGHEWVEATKKEIDKIGKGKKNVMREGYSAVLDLPDGDYFAIDGDWDDEYQGKNGMFFTIDGYNIYDNDGESIQSSPREFLSQFKPEEILKVEVTKGGIDESTRPGYHPDGTPKSNDEMSDDEREAFYNDSDFLDEHGQYADRVADVNADSTPLNEREEAIYEKYAQKYNKSIDEVKAMVKEAIALKDKAGNIQYAKDSTEASSIERTAKLKGVTLTKSQA